MEQAVGGEFNHSVSTSASKIIRMTWTLGLPLEDIWVILNFGGGIKSRLWALATCLAALLILDVKARST